MIIMKLFRCSLNIELLTSAFVQLYIILIYFAFIYSSNTSHNRRITIVSAITTDIVDLDDVTKQEKKLDENLKKDLLRTLLDFKNDPEAHNSAPPDTQMAPQQQSHADQSQNNKAYVPRAILEEYIKLRHSVRDVIPDDRDFYGKINIEDLDQPHESMWNAVNNKYNSYDIEVDMGGDTSRLGSGQFTKIKADHIAHIGTEGDPQDVPEEVVADLARSRETQQPGQQQAKKYTSVHLRFNLSQSRVYRESTAVDNLKKAELHLSREKISSNTCDEGGCGVLETASKKEGKLTEKTPIRSSKARFQRVHILQVTGYRDGNLPNTILHRSDIIDTEQNAPLSIDITSIVKTWLMNPESNHGIIVCVTNDDQKNLEARQRRHTKETDHSHTTYTSETNASLLNQESSSSHVIDDNVNDDDSLTQIPEEHIRLKRQFRGTSDDTKTWLVNQPSLLIYSIDSTKKHVKRHNQEDEADQMQADDPESISSTSNPNDDASKQQGAYSTATSSSSTTTTTTASSSSPSTSTSSSSYHRREHTPSARRGPSSTSRNSQSGTNSSGRSGSNQPGARGKAKAKPSRLVERCSKKSLAINFDEVGWSNWIIAPQAYYANYCSGDCTWPHLDDVQNSTNHAIIQAIFNSVGRVVPKSCCAPVKLSEMAILYQLDGVVQMRRYDDMIVETCGCL